MIASEKIYERHVQLFEVRVVMAGEVDLGIFPISISYNKVDKPKNCATCTVEINFPKKSQGSLNSITGQLLILTDAPFRYSLQGIYFHVVNAKL